MRTAPQSLEQAEAIAPQRTANPLQAGNDRVAAELLDELLNSALLAASAASLALWASKTGDTQGLHRLAGHVPSQPQCYSRMLSEITTDPAFSGFAAELRDYYDHLAFVRVLTRWDTACAVAGGQAAMIADCQEAAWQRLAEAGLAAIEATSSHVSPPTIEAKKVKIEQTQRLLESIVWNAPSSVDDNGKITVPQWRDRRNPRRSLFDLNVYLLINGSIQRVSVVDASERGLGISGIVGAAAGDQVDLVLHIDHIIPGRVVWTKGERAGIALDEPFPQDVSRLLMSIN